MKRFAAILLAILLFPFRLARLLAGLLVVGFVAYSFLVANTPPVAEASSIVSLPDSTPVREVAQNRIAFDTVGWYHPTVEFTDADPEVSACGPTLDRQVAVSRDLFRFELPCGTRVRIEFEDVGSVGEFIVWDTMGASKRHAVSIMLPVEEVATWTTERAWLTVLD
jgi:3D (Asp-Asp-Asp) domain-containing protein